MRRARSALDCRAMTKCNEVSFFSVLTLDQVTTVSVKPYQRYGLSICNSVQRKRFAYKILSSCYFGHFMAKTWWYRETGKSFWSTEIPLGKVFNLMTQYSPLVSCSPHFFAVLLAAMIQYFDILYSKQVLKRSKEFIDDSLISMGKAKSKILAASLDLGTFI